MSGCGQQCCRASSWRQHHSLHSTTVQASASRNCGFAGKSHFRCVPITGTEIRAAARDPRHRYRQEKPQLPVWTGFEGPWVNTQIGSNCADRLAHLTHSVWLRRGLEVWWCNQGQQATSITLLESAPPARATQLDTPHRPDHDKAPGYCLLPEGFICSDAAACFSISPSSAQCDCGHCTVSVYSKLSCRARAKTPVKPQGVGLARVTQAGPWQAQCSHNTCCRPTHLCCQHCHVVPLELGGLYRELKLIVRQPIGISPADKQQHQLTTGTQTTQAWAGAAGEQRRLRLVTSSTLYRWSAATSAAILSEPAGAAMVSRNCCAAACGLPRLCNANPSKMGATMMLMFSSPLQQAVSNKHHQGNTQASVAH